MSSPKVLHFFFPVYFDTPSLIMLREKILALLPAGKTAHFHVLDDSAGSDPALLAVRALSGVTVTEMPYNLGHQRALVFGLRKFLKNFDDDALVITMDSDGEDSPDHLAALLQAYESSRSRPIVLAKRTHRQVTLTFQIFYFFYKRIFWALTGTVIQTGNFALCHANDLKRIIFHPYFDLSYASTLVALAPNLRFVPCARSARFEGSSKMSFVSLAIHGVRMLMPFMDKIAVRGVLAFSFFFTIAFLSVAILAISYLLGLFEVPAWALIGALMTLILCFLSIFSFVVLMTIFVNVQSLALSRLESGRP